MKVITLLNEKGGVGKTTTATTIAALLAKMGHSTCVIDTDTQGHVAERLKLRSENGFYKLIQGAAWHDVLRPVAPAYYGGKTETPKLWVVPGYDATRELDNELDAINLIERLEETQEEFEFVIFDTSPKLGAIHAALYAVSDYVIIPTECTRLSVKGVISTINHIKQAEPQANKAGLSVGQVLGIVPTKFNGTKKVHYQNLGWIAGRYGDEILFPAVKFLTDWEKAESLQVPVYMYNPRSEAASDARGLVEAILSRIEVANA
jgi:chromosome partitioning protein